LTVEIQKALTHLLQGTGIESKRNNELMWCIFMKNPKRAVCASRTKFWGSIQKFGEKDYCRCDCQEVNAKQINANALSTYIWH